ncbi:RHS repeat domain-containing protein [Streptomyces sp. S186]|uniref:RHS repeat domain-containing protein n=1 Tax=Streptomyces sp. S186 TaxID=3434395 RepID=UPI003F66E29B
MTWPKPGKVTADLVKNEAISGRRPVRQLRAGTLPLTLASAQGASEKKEPTPDKVVVETLDRSAADKANVEGVLLKISPQGRATSGGDIEVELDYSGFRYAYGGDWASRLTLVRLPECALTDPGKDGCRTSTPLRGVRNDLKTGKLKAKVSLPTTDDGEVLAKQGGFRQQSMAAAPLLLAATAEVSGASGDYKATSLSPSSSWQAGGSSGGFTWAYPMTPPKAPGGLEPKLNLAYSSQSVDGRTAATNNQANWVGDGWSLSENFIERRYKPCIDDMKDGNNKAKNGDQCWGTDNATISLNGKSNELVKDDKTGTWKLKHDDGTRVERLADTNRGNGDNDGEYWRVTTPDGTQYHFGYNRLPGWSKGKPETNSTWNAPVYGNHKGEPCYKDKFADSWCNQAWRWNLDYVVDSNNNAMAYYYATETNRYARNVSLTTGKGTPTEYTRGGYLARIEYGLRADNVYGANAAAAKVKFTTAERCLPGKDFDCAEDKFTKANAKHWPDVPFDQYCKAGEDCKEKYSPTFWTRKRLQKVNTEVLVDGKYQPVDSWELKHSFPSTGDGSAPALWLSSLTRTGHTAGTAESLPPVEFYGTQMANRVEKAVDAVPPLVRYRVYKINTETGGTIGVTYSEPDCTADKLPADSSNSTRCFPVYWSSEDAPAAEGKLIKDWFHKYVVTQVDEIDNTGGSPIKRTNYSYLGGAAWAKSQDELVKPEHRTYSDFRGYARVQTRIGADDDKRLLTEQRFFRGISGDQVADAEGNKVADHESFSGMLREQDTYDGDGGKLLSATTYEPWQKGATASHARPGLVALEAHVVGVKAENSRTAVGNGWRRTKTERSFDEYGMVTEESDLGDTAKSGDEVCTRTIYARNPNNRILDAVASQMKLATACSDKPDLPADLISERRSYYDGSTKLGELPDKGRGLVTRTDENDGKGTGFLTTETSTYDPYGRKLSSTDVLKNKTTTIYTPATGANPTKSVITNPLGHTTTSELDARRGETTAVIDPNGKRTDTERDAFGRLAKIWKQGRAKSNYPDSPSIAHTYTVSKTEPVSVKTTTLHGDATFSTDYTLYDGLLRERQTQSTSANGEGRVITEKRYDTRGLVWKSYGGYYTNGDPSSTLVKADDTKIPNITETIFDGAGRPTVAIARKYGDETFRSSTAYDGDRTTVTPPQGGTATTRIIDALGRTTELIQYTNNDRTQSQSTHYSYDKHGALAEVTDPVGAKWKYTYDSRGRKIAVDDPDKGKSSFSYDNADHMVASTDANKQRLTISYDAIGRKTELKQGDTVLSEWTYDTLAKGQLTSAKRYIDGKAFVSEVTAFDEFYNPKASQIAVPDSAGALAGTYKWSFAYNDKTGLVESITQPGLGGLPAERVTTRYNSLDLPQATFTGGRELVSGTTYDPFGRSIRDQYGPLGKRLYTSSTYDEQTGRVTRVTNDRETAPQRIDDTSYDYDPAGNLTRLTTVSGQDATKSTDTQCFTTDALRRITQAWTATDGCAAKPEGDTKPKVGGPDSYWHSYTYDAAGSRATEVQHDISGDATKDIQRTYSYPAQNNPQPHAIQSVATKIGGKATPGGPDTYRYDAAGNVSQRQVAGKGQQLTWDAEGHLSKVVEDGKTTSYVYDTDGNRIIRRDTTGTTLYLPGGNELLIKPDGKSKVGTRYYSHAGKNVAVQAGGKISYLLSDHHGTATTSVDAATLMVTSRRTGIFGTPRGSQPANWPGDRGFVGGSNEKTTGLIHLGAREYDPTLGQFISVDPVMDLTDSQQLQGYAYGNNNPLTYSDPTGMLYSSSDLFEIGLGALLGGLWASGSPLLEVVAVETSVRRHSSSSYSARKRYVGTRASAAYKSQLPVQGLNPLNPNPVQIVALWFMGAAPSQWGFTEGDQFTEDIRNMPWIAKIKKLLGMCKECSVGQTIKGLDYKTKYGEREFGIPIEEMPIADGSAALMRALGDREAGPGAAQAVLGSFSLEAKIESHDKRSGEARVNFTLKNRMGVESLTREISEKGYSTGAKDSKMSSASEMIKQYFPNGQRDANMTVHWSETIKMPWLSGAGG